MAHRAANVGLDGAMQLDLGGVARIDLFERRQHYVEERCKRSGLLHATERRWQRRLNGAAPLVTEHDEERRGEVLQRVAEAAEDLRPDHVSRHPHDEQIAQALVEHHLGRNARIAASEDGREWILRLRQVDQAVVARQTLRRLAADEPRVAVDQPLQRFRRDDHPIRTPSRSRRITAKRTTVFSRASSWLMLQRSKTPPNRALPPTSARRRPPDRTW